MTAGADGLPSNAQLAELFRKLADYLSLEGQSSYRILAYEKASTLFANHPVSVAHMALRGELRDLAGVGEAIESKVIEYISTGHVHALDQLAARYPEGLLTVMHLPGVGPKTARKLWDSAGIGNVEALEEACSQGVLREIPGLGSKTEENIGRAIVQWRRRTEATVENRRLLVEVEPQAAHLVTFLRSLPGVAVADYAGSLRRRRSLVRDIDLVAGAEDAGSVMDAFAELPELARIDERGETKLVALTHSGLNVDLRIVAPASYGNLLQHMTGSAAHNVALRGYAQKRGFKISEYDIEHVKSGRKVYCASEDEVYGILDLEVIPPELRENCGEIEAAAGRLLPKLIQLQNIRGDLHVHSNWSDGRATMEEMALAAKERGLDYICFCDHSHSLTVADGITEERLLAQIEEIRALNEKLDGIQILSGTEVDILVDGRLDWPDEILAKLDFVTASIHTGFSQPREQIMQRLIGAMQNPHVRSIAHPTGVLLTRREPYEIDLEELARVAAQTGTYLEINASCERLDLSAPAARRAVELGATIVICSDAHRPAEFENLQCGIWEARRGWVEADKVANTRPWADLAPQR